MEEGRNRGKEERGDSLSEYVGLKPPWDLIRETEAKLGCLVPMLAEPGQTNLPPARFQERLAHLLA